jgi:outer membrane protein assembly factor BamB
MSGQSIRSLFLAVACCSLTTGTTVWTSVAIASQQASPATTNPFLPVDLADPGWKFIRGPTSDGHSPEIHIADTWPADGPPILWTRDLGQGYSAFVADRGRVYTQRQSLGGQYLVCLDGDTGETIWEHRYDWPYEAAGVYPGPRATPTVSDDRVYFAAPSGLVGCVTATEGRPVWSRNVVADFKGKGTEFGFASSPTVVNGKVILPVGGTGASMVALDARTGATIWQSGDDPASYTPAFPITWNDRQLVVGYLQNALVVFDLATGQQLCRLELSRGYDEHSAWPIYSEPHIWISGPFQWGSQLLELTDDGGSLNLKSVWKEKTMSNDIVSSVLVGGAVFGFDVRDPQAKTHRPTRGHFRAIDLLTGREHWSNAALNYREVRVDATPGPSRERGPDQPAPASPRIGHASVIVADEKLILLNDTGELMLGRATAERYEELGRVRILGGEIGWTQPILQRGRLYARNQSRAVCVYLGEPRLFESRQLAPTLKAADLPQGKYRDWASLLLSVEPEYAFDVPSDQWLRDWFRFSMLGVFAPALVLAGLTWLALRRRQTMPIARGIFGTASFLLGAAGTTAFSYWTGEFVFTWPVCLFVVFWAAVSHVRLHPFGGSVAQPRPRWPGYATLALFLVVCAAYFLLCRRFSLLFEWIFLAGFPAATPPALVSIWWAKHSRFAAATELFGAAVSFTLFYWSSVLILWLRY